MTSAVLAWLVACDQVCPPAMLRAAWTAAVNAGDVTVQTRIAARTHAAPDLDVLIAATRTPQVRAAYLRRDGLAEQRIAELLRGETRAVVLGALLTGDAPAWATEHTYKVFVARPTWRLADILLDCDQELPQDVLVALVGLLVPRLAQLRYGRHLPQALQPAVAASAYVIDPAARSGLLNALTPLWRVGDVPDPMMARLLEGPVTDEALTTFGTSLLTGALHRMEAAQTVRELRALFMPLLAREHLPPQVAAMAQQILDHPIAQNLGFGDVLLPSGPQYPDLLRSTADLAALTIALHSRHPADLLNILMNPALPDEQVPAAVQRLVQIDRHICLKGYPSGCTWMLSIACHVTAIGHHAGRGT